MKALVFVFDSFMEFEISLLVSELKERAILRTAGLTKKPIHTSSGLTIKPDYKIDEIKLYEYDLLIIPGGNPAQYLNDKKVLGLIKAFQDEGKQIAAISEGTVILAKSGILVNKQYTTSVRTEYNTLFPAIGYTDQNCTIDGNIITAKNIGFIDFALEIGRSNRLFRTAEQEEKFLKEFLPPSYVHTEATCIAQ